MRKLYPPILLALLAASCVAPEDHVELRHSPILGGSAGSVGQFPGVVAIYNQMGFICTGSLIAPDLVVTAAHCVSASVISSEMGQNVSQSQVTANTEVIFDSTNIDSNGGSVAASDTLGHPSFNINNLGRHDIGLIWLSQSVNDRSPIVLNRSHSDAPVGISTTLVGYGINDANQSGRLYYLNNKTTVSCNSVGGGSDSYLLCYNQTDGKGSCSGDSGGPSLANIGGTQKLVGITSFGDQYCQQMGAYTRVDAELDFLDEYAPELACLADGSCNEDCGSGGLPDDPDCTDVDPCAANGSCNTDCYSGGTSSDPDCPNCATNGSCNAECGTNGTPVDADCPTCTLDGECEPECGSGGYPADPDCPLCIADGECEAGCTPADPDCPDCVNNDDCGDPNLQCVDGSCAPIETDPPGSLGDICSGNDECISGICGAGPGGVNRCVALCDPAASTCPDGFDCLSAGDSGACWPASGDDPEDNPNSSGVSGGCAVGGGSSSGAPALGLLLLALAVFRRRRRHSC